MCEEDSPARFLGGDGAAMCCPYPTRSALQTEGAEEVRPAGNLLSTTPMKYKGLTIARESLVPGYPWTVFNVAGWVVTRAKTLKAAKWYIDAITADEPLSEDDSLC